MEGYLGSRRVQGWAGSGWFRIWLGINSFSIIIFSISLNEIISFHNFYRLGYIRLGYVSRGVSTGPSSINKKLMSNVCTWPWSTLR